MGLKITECKHKSQERWAIILISENICLKQKILVEIKMEIFMIIQKSIQQEDTTITNVKVPNNWASKYMKQKFRKLKEKLEKHL